MNWLKRIRTSLQQPDATQVARAHLAEAQRDRLVAAANREHYQHAERMLNERVDRLQRELAQIEAAQ